MAYKMGVSLRTLQNAANRRHAYASVPKNI